MEIIYNTLNCPRNFYVSLKEPKGGCWLAWLPINRFLKLSLSAWPRLARPNIIIFLPGLLQSAGGRKCQIHTFTPEHIVRATTTTTTTCFNFALAPSSASIIKYYDTEGGGGTPGQLQHSVFLILTDGLVSHHWPECQRSDNARWDGTECWIIKSNRKAAGWVEEWTACEHQDQSLSDNIFSCDVLQSGVESWGVFRCSVGCKSGDWGVYCR